MKYGGVEGRIGRHEGVGDGGGGRVYGMGVGG